MIDIDSSCVQRRKSDELCSTNNKVGHVSLESRKRRNTQTSCALLLPTSFDELWLSSQQNDLSVRLQLLPQCVETTKRRTLYHGWLRS